MNTIDVIFKYLQTKWQRRRHPNANEIAALVYDPETNTIKIG